MVSERTVNEPPSMGGHWPDAPDNCDRFWFHKNIRWADCIICKYYCEQKNCDFHIRAWTARPKRTRSQIDKDNRENKTQEKSLERAVEADLLSDSRTRLKKS